MIRKLILPAVACLVLAGCATGYGYRSDRGDYYYGQPDVDYRYYGGGYYDYGYPYGYGPYRGYSRYGYRGYGGYWGYPYYPRYYYRPPYYGGHYDHDDDYDRPSPRPDSDSDDGGVPPWRDLDNLRMRKSDPLPAQRRAEPPRGASRAAIADPAPAQRPVTRPPPRPTPRPAIQSRSRDDASDRGSRMERLIRRSRGGSDADERRIPR